MLLLDLRSGEMWAGSGVNRLVQVQSPDLRQRFLRVVNGEATFDGASPILAKIGGDEPAPPDPNEPQTPQDGLWVDFSGARPVLKGWTPTGFRPIDLHVRDPIGSGPFQQVAEPGSVALWQSLEAMSIQVFSSVGAAVTHQVSRFGTAPTVGETDPVRVVVWAGGVSVTDQNGRATSIGSIAPTETGQTHTVSLLTRGGDVLATMPVRNSTGRANRNLSTGSVLFSTGIPNFGEFFAVRYNIDRVRAADNSKIVVFEKVTVLVALEDV